MTVAVARWIPPQPWNQRDLSRNDERPNQLVDSGKKEYGLWMVEAQEDGNLRGREHINDNKVAQLSKRSGRLPPTRIQMKLIGAMFAEAIQGVEPRNASPKEIADHLTDEQNQELADARRGKNDYPAALEAVRQAERAGRDPTETEIANLAKGRADSATYTRLRTQALKNFVLSRTAPIEVIAYWERRRQQKKDYKQGMLEAMTDEERTAYYEDLVRHTQERNAVRKTRIGVLEALARTRSLDAAEQRELDELNEYFERQKPQYHDLSPEKKGASLEGWKARTRPQRDEELATRRRLEPLVKSGKAKLEEERLYWYLRHKLDDENATRKTRDVYLKELERIVTDPKGGATEAQKKEWDDYVKERERRQAQNQARKAGQNQQAGDSNQDDGRRSSSTGSTDPSNQGSLQWSLNSPWLSGKQFPSWLIHRLDQLPQSPHDVARLSGQHSSQLRNLVQQNWRSVVTAARNPRLRPSKALPRPAGLPAGTRIPV